MSNTSNIIKLQNASGSTDYYPVSVSEAIFHKEEGGTLKQLSEIINELPDTSSFITTEEAQRIVSQYAYSKDESDNRYTQYGDVEELVFEKIE